MAKTKLELNPPLGLLVTLSELLDEQDIAKMSPLLRAFCRLDYPNRRWVLAQVKRLQDAVPDLAEDDALEILAVLGQWLNNGGGGCP